MSVRSRLWLPLTSTTFLLTPVLAVIGVLISLNNATYASPYWLDLSAKATISLLLLGPGYAAVSAWDAARWRTVASAASRTWLELWGRHLVIVALATTATFGLTLGLLYLDDPPRTGAPRIDVLAAGVLSTVGYAAMGFAVGRLLPRVVAAPAAFLVTWLWVAYTPAIEPLWLRNLTGHLGTSCCGLDVQLAPHALAAPAVVAIGILGAAAAMLAVGRLRAALVVALALVVTGVTAGGLLVRDLGADPVVARQGAQECQTAEGTTWCAWPEHADRLERAVPRLATAIAGLRSAGLLMPEVLREGVRTDGWAFDLSSTDEDSWADILSVSPLDQMPPPCTDTNGGTWPAGRYYETAAAWLQIVSGSPVGQAISDQGASRKKVEALRAGTPEAQLDWFQSAYHAMQTCDPVR